MGDGCGSSDTAVHTGALITTNECHNNWFGFKNGLISSWAGHDAVMTSNTHTNASCHGNETNTHTH